MLKNLIYNFDTVFTTIEPVFMVNHTHTHTL